MNSLQRSSIGLMLVSLLLFSNDISRASALFGYQLNPKFELINDKNEKVKLSDFKGKFVHLDFWATWCKPCLAEITDTKHMQNELADVSDQVVFLTLSFDNSKVNWLKTIKQHRMEGIHLWVGPDKNEEIKAEFGVESLPFYVWVNQEGMVVKYNAPRPSTGPANKIRRAIKKNN
ncbi:MAG: TlpA disulfide reductase family protein [Bacteroidota bacterium]|nr:TlpA disulfide reductase family protein [Bacteroidota bacterium]